MTEDGYVYQVRKVFDPKTMGVREELVATGEAEAPATDEPREQQGPTLQPGEEGVLTVSEPAEANDGVIAKAKAKVKRKRGKKK